jgi:hypothetical protein
MNKQSLEDLIEFIDSEKRIRLLNYLIAEILIKPRLRKDGRNLGDTSKRVESV